jgi:hypothetical protein
MQKTEDELLAKEVHEAAKVGRFVTARELLKRIKDPEYKRQATESLRVYTLHNRIATYEVEHGNRPPPVTAMHWEHVREQMKLEAEDEPG